MSVVVCTFNGSKTVGRTLDSLLMQNYPAASYEIIVVDDGSTDTTAEIVQSYPGVSYIKHAVNEGVAAARNTGLKVARGDIYVALDDDCIVDPNWLSKLESGYAQDNPAGVCGQLTPTAKPKGLVMKYLQATGFGVPPLVKQGKQTTAKRLWQYLRGCFQADTDVRSAELYVEVEEFYGANSSFPIDVLRAVKGWDLSMNLVEDRDISVRIRKKFPDRPLYAVRTAKIDTDPAISLTQYLLRPFKRGPANLRFHVKNKLAPPIFPFPIILLLSLAAAAWVQPRAILLVLVFGPLLLYFRWLLYGIHHRQLIAALFPYLQIAEETMVILGLVHGYIFRVKNSRRAIRYWLRPTVAINIFITLIWAAYTMHGTAGHIRESFSILYLLLVPGYFTLRAIIGYSERLVPVKVLVYSVSLSLVSLMILGLGTNQLLTLFGDQHPLMAQPLTYAISGFSLLMTIAAAVRKPLALIHSSHPISYLRRGWHILLIGCLLPVTAVGGAVTLNNGGTNWLALTTFSILGVFFITLLWSTKPAIKNYYPFALYSMCLTILLGTSMRGWNITGHDVMQEYQVYELTLRHAAWNMSYYQDAYNACLSITILPTIFQKLTGVTDQYVYKFIFQLFFALIAPILYTSFCHFTKKRIALLAAFIFVTFPSFLTDVTMLNRQETALMCYALAIMAALDTQLKRRHKSLLALIFLVGMVFSHYSTSYVTVATLLLMLVLQGFGVGLAKIFYRRARKVTHVHPIRLFSYPVIAITIVLLVAWGGFATQTSSNISQTIQGVITGIPHLLSTPQSSSSKLGQASSSASTVRQYLLSAKSSRTLPTADYYSPSITGNDQITAQSETVASVNTTLQAHGLSTATVYKLYNAAVQSYGVLIEGIVGLSVALILFIKSIRRKITGQYKYIIIASVGIIGIQVVMPASLINYGLLRVIQQSLVVLALPIALAAIWLLGVIRISEKWAIRLVGIAMVVFFFILSGFLPTLTGGYKPSLALNNNGFYYEAYYTHQAEVAADSWLQHDTPLGSRVYSDEFSRRKMIAYADIFSQPTLAPDTIPIDSYVYLSQGNVTTNKIPVYYNGNLIYYSIPYNFLNTNKNLVYTSQDVRIYK